MRQQFLVLFLIFITSCGKTDESVSSFELVPPTAVPVTDDDGTLLTNQPGPLWVLVSGIDEHGLREELELTLLTEPAITAEVAAIIPTGQAAMVDEIRQSGPQGLRRFYHVHIVGSVSGWISDFYIRRLGYVFLPDTDHVPLYDGPNGQVVENLPNVSPVTLIDPTDANWWQVQVINVDASGWIPAQQVKESSAPSFLLNLPNEGHDHDEHEHE